MSEPREKAPFWAWCLATGFGSGRMKPAPGTWGSLAGLAAWVLFTGGLAWLLGGAKPVARGQVLAIEGAFLGVGVGLTWVAVKASTRVVRQTGSHDPGFIVIDEWVGMVWTLWPLRWVLLEGFPHWGWREAWLLGAAFCLFRLLDIWKPWPIDPVQVLPEGEGIVADDLVAGLIGIPLISILAAWIQAAMAS